jgi:hypothetical protein
MNLMICQAYETTENIVAKRKHFILVNFNGEEVEVHRSITKKFGMALTG